MLADIPKPGFLASRPGAAFLRAASSLLGDRIQSLNKLSNAAETVSYDRGTNSAAKDKAMGKEQQIRIQASGGLTEAEIQRMIKEEAPAIFLWTQYDTLATAAKGCDGLVATALVIALSLAYLALFDFDYKIEIWPTAHVFRPGHRNSRESTLPEGAQDEAGEQQ